MKGYKAFDGNFKCRGFQYEVGQTYTIDEYPIMCRRGFHFCQLPVSVVNYYNWINNDCQDMRFAEVEAYGALTEGDKSVTDKIKIVREITREEFEKLCTGQFEIYHAKRHYYQGQLHRDDGPAIEYKNGDKYWYKNGQLHRDDGPSIEYSNGFWEWYKNGQIHRDDGPAVQWPDSSIYWYKNGQLHRDDGPAVERVDGTRIWYRYGHWDHTKSK